MSAVVGPLRQIRFRDGSTQVYDPPRDTRDLRWIGCIDHHPACDCREAEMTENLTELRAEARLAEMAEQAITAVLRIHCTAPEAATARGAPTSTPAPRASCSSPTHPSIRFGGEAPCDRPDHRAGTCRHRHSSSPPRSSHPRASRSG